MTGRRARAACACVLALLATPWSQGAQIPEAWQPSGIFVQAAAGRHVASAAIGANPITPHDQKCAGAKPGLLP